MKAVHEKYGDRIQVVAVNVSGEERTTVDAFVKEHELPYTILMNGDQLYRGTYRGRGIPHTYVIDAKGEITEAYCGWAGDRHRKMLEALIDKLLAD